MFVPKMFEETDRSLIKNCIEQNSFATLMTNSMKGLWGTHIPFLFDLSEGEHGVLEGHISKANIQHKNFNEEEKALVIFQGPHHYISPNWYETNDVPTWNYLSVHVYGTIKVINDEKYLLDHLEKMVQKYEKTIGSDWSMDSLDKNYVKKLTRAIVGFKIEIDRIEAKSKLGQNRSVADMKGYIQALENVGSENALGVAEIAKIKLKEKSD